MRIFILLLALLMTTLAYAVPIIDLGNITNIVYTIPVINIVTAQEFVNINGTCPTGYAVQNITNSTLQCVLMSGGNVSFNETDPIFTSWYNAGSPRLNNLFVDTLSVNHGFGYITMGSGIDFNGNGITQVSQINAAIIYQGATRVANSGEFSCGVNQTIQNVTTNASGVFGDCVTQISGINGLNGTNGINGTDGAGDVTWIRSGNNIYNNNTGNVGVGVSIPAQKLDVNTTIAISGVTVAYRPSAFTGSLILGNGGTSLAHSTGQEGYYNTFVGLSSGTGTAYGAYNTALGHSSFLTNSYGDENVAIGYATMRSNTIGDYNSAVGKDALYSNTNGNYNTVVGYQTMYLSGTGIYNTAVGSQALYTNSNGNYSTAIGTEALRFSTTSSNNTAVGYRALYDLGYQQTAGTFNIGFKYTIKTVGTTNFMQVGAASNTIGVIFTANASGSGTGIAYPNTENNTAIGVNTGHDIYIGSGNTLIGANIIGLPSNLTNNIIISDGSGNQRIRVDNNGNVGIGRNNPIKLLDVNSTTIRFLASDNTSQGMCLNSTQGGVLSTYKC